MPMPVGGQHVARVGFRPWVLALVALLATCVAAPALATEPADVLLVARQLQADVDNLSTHLGVAPDARPPIDVRDVAPFEVYFQATALREKARRLEFERTRTLRPAPPEAPEDLVPAAVKTVLGDVSHCLAALLKAESLPPSMPPLDRDPATTPTDVYRTIVATSRQMDRLLVEQIAPADVYQRVTEALGYALDLRLQYPAARPPPKTTRRDAQPADVHALLSRVLTEVQATARSVGQPTLTLGPALPESVVPADVYELASLVAAEFRQLARRADLRVNQEVPYPGPKEPADVLQRAEQLRAIAADLAVNAAADPAPLQGGAAP